jgi:hypothetical protein
MKEIFLNEYTSVQELATLLEVSQARLIERAFKTLGLLTTINELLKFEQASRLAAEFGYKARRAS